MHSHPHSWDTDSYIPVVGIYLKYSYTPPVGFDPPTGSYITL